MYGSIVSYGTNYFFQFKLVCLIKEKFSDMNKNVCVGFYMRTGYNTNGKHMATEYKTK